MRGASSLANAPYAKRSTPELRRLPNLAATYTLNGLSLKLFRLLEKIIEDLDPHFMEK